MTYVLGIHGFSAKKDHPLHDTGVSLIKDGEVLAAINEERFSRIKMDGNFPWKSYYKIFELGNINPKDIKYVAFTDRKPLWQLRTVFYYLLKSFLKTGIFPHNYLLESIVRTKDIRRTKPTELHKINCDYIEHHVAHASSAYFTCPWNKTTVITLDGMGDYCIGGTISIGYNGKLHILKRTNGMFSPGIFYMIITDILGFTPGRHEGKVTGLAAYGDPNKCYDIMKNIIHYQPGKLEFMSRPILKALNRCSFVKQKCDLSYFIKLLKNYSKEEIAAAAQKRLEDIVISFIEDALKLSKIKNLVLAGGIFANVKMNQLIKEKLNIQNIYIHPNMGDAGLATGATLYTYYNKIINNTNYLPKFLKNLYLGPSYNDQIIQKCLTEHNISYTLEREMEKKIAESLYNNKILGHFYGRMEYGPRALGNRSILATPTNPDLNKVLNKRLRRTEFMPFAPSILEEYVNDYIDNWTKDDIASYFMTITYNVKKKFKQKAPAAVHIDGTVRPQVVRFTENPRYYKIIKEFFKLTEIPLIINTSFNIHEEPIVCTPNDAIKAYEKGVVDILILNNYWIE